MLRNYLTIAFRNLMKNKTYAFINIVGLAIGLTAALFIFRYIQFESSYDDFHEDAENIYRIILHATINGKEVPPYHSSSAPMVTHIKREIPEVIETVRLFQNREIDVVISYDSEDGTPTKDFLERRLYYVDPSFMEMFSFPMIIGNPETLKLPNTILISETMANKIFGPDWRLLNPIGKVIKVDGKRELAIQGVFRDVPPNSHLKFEGLASYKSINEINYDTVWYHMVPTYIKVAPKTDINILEDKLIKNAYEKAERIFKEGFNIDTSYVSLQNIRDVHLHSKGISGESEVRGSYITLQFILIAALFILVLAWINYVNLSTARAIKRAKEVGIRKLVGARKKHLVTQFLLEAFVISCISVLLAATLYQLAYPYVSDLMHNTIPRGTLVETPWFFVFLLLVLLLGTLLAGGYTAFFISSIKAVKTMKGGFVASTRGIMLRKGLVILQFVVSLGLIVGTITVFQQMHYLKNQELGYDIAQKLIVKAPRIKNENYEQHYEQFKNVMLQEVKVNSVTSSYVSPGDPPSMSAFHVSVQNDPEDKSIASVNIVDYDYLQTYGIELLHGRWFSRDYPADDYGVVISEEFAQELGYFPTEKALQEKLVFRDSQREYSIIGITENIRLYSLKYVQRGAIFFLKQDLSANNIRPIVNFTVDLDNTYMLEETISNVESHYKASFPGNPFEYYFLDEYFNTQYQAEEQFGKLFMTASSLAIVIACLGLFGLSSFVTKQRTKEIGIRKVLGASSLNILLLLIRNYVKLVMLASAIALPIAYLFLNQWLSTYIYRIELSWWMFILPIALVLIIALITISVHTIYVARTNPSKSLRYE